MLDQKVAVPDDEIPEEVMLLLGRYNDAPIGFTEVDEEYIVKRSLLRMYSPKFTAFKQIRWEGALLSIHCSIFFDNTGIAYSMDYWAGKIRWFRFGCEHEYFELSSEESRKLGLMVARCWHNNKCKKCGFIYSYDSSD